MVLKISRNVSCCGQGLLRQQYHGAVPVWTGVDLSGVDRSRYKKQLKIGQSQILDHTDEELPRLLVECSLKKYFAAILTALNKTHMSLNGNESKTAAKNSLGFLELLWSDYFAISAN